MLRGYVKLYKARQWFYYLYIDKQLNDMKVNIKGNEIELIYCQRIYIKFEEMYQRTLTMEQLSSYSVIADLIYCTILATLEHKKNRDKYNIILTREEFDDWYDDDATIITHDFTQWFIECVQEQMDKLKSHIEEQKNPDDKNKIKKTDPKK